MAERAKWSGMNKSGKITLCLSRTGATNKVLGVVGFFFSSSA